MGSHDISKPYFPGFTRKSVAFTIDDGVFEMDKKFISIIAPFGIKGTFNLCSDRYERMDTREVLALYQGYEIANHCKYHPYYLLPEQEAYISDAFFDEASADPEKIYPSKIEGLYYRHLPKGWRTCARACDYLRFAREGERELEAIFGEGSVKGFVWPFGKQMSDEIYEGLIRDGNRTLRNGKSIYGTTGYAIAEDLTNWCFNTMSDNLMREIPLYQEYPDDGELKLFCLGGHSIDFERGNNFCDLEYFARTFGNKPEEYYTAGVDEIFRYSVAAKSLIVTDETVENPSDMDIYIKIDDMKVIVRAHTRLDLESKKLIF